jgi:hypothetical protein
MTEQVQTSSSKPNESGISRESNTTDQVKVQSFKLEKDMNKSYAAGSLIIFIGFCYTFIATLPTLIQNGYIDNPLIAFGNNYFGLLMDLIFYYAAAIFFLSSDFILNASIGWFLGGFVSAVIYGRDVPRPSTSGTLLFISSILQFMFLVLLINPAASQTPPFPTDNSRFLYFTSLFSDFDMTIFLLPLLAIILISALLAFISALGYTLGKLVT